MDSKKIKYAITRMLLMVLGGGVGFVAAKFGISASHTASTAHVVTVIILFIPVFFLTIGIHEAGHALAGRFVNFSFRLYVVGPFMWDKEETGWKFKWNKNVNISGGLVICIPTSTENLAKRFSTYALGGPTASLVFAALAYGAKLTIDIFNTNQSSGPHITASIFGLISFMSLIIFIITIVPMHTAGFYTDGARALRFLRGGDTARFDTLLMSLISKSYSGIRPRLLNKEELLEASVLAQKLNTKMKVYIHYYQYQVSFDEGNLDEALIHLHHYLANIDSIPKGLQGSAYLDAAFFYAYAKKDLEQAENYWKQFVPSAIIPKAHVLATEAALSFLKKDYLKMNAAIEKARIELPNMMDRGIGRVLAEQLTELTNLQSTH